MFRTICILFLFAGLSSPAWALGEETIGNEPLNQANYSDWPNVIGVVNDTHRVFHQWVNGNEFFYFDGDVAALNAAIKKFAEVKSDKLTVVLRPGPTEAHTFQQDKSFQYFWNLHLVGGIARHMSTLDQGANIWSPTPVLSVYVREDTDLSKLEIPGNIELLEIADLQTSYAKGLSSKDQTVRGWSCGEIAALDPYDAEAKSRIEGMLADPVDWVKLNAAGALATYGTLARLSIPVLESIKTDDQQLQTRIKETIEKIQAAKSDSEAAKQHTELVQRIHEFVERRRIEQRK